MQVQEASAMIENLSASSTYEVIVQVTQLMLKKSKRSSQHIPATRSKYVKESMKRNSSGRELPRLESAKQNWSYPHTAGRRKKWEFDINCTPLLIYQVLEWYCSFVSWSWKLALHLLSLSQWHIYCIPDLTNFQFSCQRPNCLTARSNLGAESLWSGSLQNSSGQNSVGRFVFLATFIVCFSLLWI